MSSTTDIQEQQEPDESFNKSDGEERGGNENDDDEEERGRREETRSDSRNSRNTHSRRSDKSECYSEKMAREIRKKADLRAQRSDDPSNPIRVRTFNDHRLRVKTAKAKVDSSSPVSTKVIYMNPNYQVRLNTFARIERENTIMLQHLASIIHGKGMVDNRLDARKTKSCGNRGQDRQIRLLHITFDNLNLLKRIQQQKPFYSRKEQLKEYKSREATMSQMSLYPLFWQLSKECQWGPLQLKAKQNAENRPYPRCELILGNSKEIFGPFVVELNAKECPMTAENFRGLCTGEYGLSYKCSMIHRVLQDILWQGGDITGEGGSGNKSVYGETFPDENFKLKHDRAGVISMANCGPNTNGSQFLITAKKLSVLDGANVAFGRVISGMGVLKGLYNKVSPSGKPKKKVYIVDCREMEPGEELPEPEEDEDEDDEGDQIQEDDGNGSEGPTNTTTASEPETYDTTTEGDEETEPPV